LPEQYSIALCLHSLVEANAGVGMVAACAEIAATIAIAVLI
jgi:hypothetical protein